MKTENAVLAFRVWAIFYPAIPLLLLALIAWRRPHLWRRGFRRIENGWRRLARRRGAGTALIAGVSLSLSLALSCGIRWPEPVIADEFSYLLAADTFLAGRATNPPHPHWEHFESLHLIQQPSYASKYQPGPGLLLAVARRLTGTPVTGLWLVIALGCLAIRWMLGAWLRPRHALLGGLLAAIHPLILEWGQNFWGGGLPLLGGALTLGALGRIWQQPRQRDGLILGAGLALLALSRPFEGALLGLLGGLLTGWALLRRQLPASPVRIVQVALLALLVVTPVLLLLGWYNQRVTGNAWRMPYLVHQQTYAIATPFLWQRLQPAPAYRHESIRRFYLEYELPSWQSLQSISGLIRKGIIRKLGIVWRGYFATPVMALGLLLFIGFRPGTPHSRRLRLLGGLFLAGVFLETWLLPHYLAPAAGVIFFATVEAWRRLRGWSIDGARTGLWLARAALLCALCGIVQLAFRLDRDQRRDWAWATERSRLERELPRDGRRHLILVSYGPAHNLHQEWVYNPAEIDRAPVVWARAMDEPRNRNLIDYYHDRTCHRLKIDAGPPTLRPCQ